MRLAVITWTRARLGGTETYLAQVIPHLLDRGYEVGLLYEISDPPERNPIELPAGSASWCVEELGVERALKSLRAWGPDLLYAHGLQSPQLEAETLNVAPAVFFAHNYYGTCISGSKTWKSPRPVPCSRRFGWPCLLHYYPHRCGGLSPVTMLRLHRLQATRRRLLNRYRALVTHSEHMRQEYIKHGYPADRIFNFTYYVGRGPSEPLLAIRGTRAGANGQGPTSTWKRASGGGEHRLLFLGRMDRLKGGGTLLSALRQVKAAFPGPLKVTFAGDGPERRAWEREARRVSAAHRDLVIEFVGWVGRERRRELLGACDLLVLPSLWPEPFGRVGLEAGLQGVPVVAFAVGGIPEWLRDGVNGYLAPGDPPTAGGLAEAILRALRDSRAELREGARRIADEFSIENHLAHLELVFAKVLGDDWLTGIHDDDRGRSSPSAVTLAHSPDPDVASR